MSRKLVCDRVLLARLMVQGLDGSDRPDVVLDADRSHDTSELMTAGSGDLWSRGDYANAGELADALDEGAKLFCVTLGGGAWGYTSFTLWLASNASDTSNDHALESACEFFDAVYTDHDEEREFDDEDTAAATYGMNGSVRELDLASVMVEQGGSGYTDCRCRDCMDLVVSDEINAPEFCHACEEAGCPDYQGSPGMRQECQREDEPDEEDPDNDSDEQEVAK